MRRSGNIAHGRKGERFGSVDWESFDIAFVAKELAKTDWVGFDDICKTGAAGSGWDC